MSVETARLVTLAGTLLSLPFLANFINPTSSFPFMSVQNPVPVGGLAILGLLLCLYAHTALRDIREHIESNRRKAGYVLEGKWEFNWVDERVMAGTCLLRLAHWPRSASSRCCCLR